MNQPELTAKIMHWIQMLRTRPKTLIPTRELTYDSVSFYVYGYLAGIGDSIGRSLEWNVANWRMQQRREFTPEPFHNHIRRLHKAASEEELINLLLDDIEGYFKQNPDWQEVDIPSRIWFDDEKE